MVANGELVRSGRPRDRRVDVRIQRATWYAAGQRRRPPIAMENIARCAGIGKTSLYRRFDGIEPLLASVVGDAVQRRSPLPDCGELRRDLDAARAHFDRILANARSRRGWLAVIDAASSYASIGAALESAVSARRDDLSNVFRRAQRRGDIAADADPASLADLFVNLVVAELAIGSRWMSPGGGEDHVVGAVMRAARPREAEVTS